MNLKKVGLAAIISSAFAFVACDNTVAANDDAVIGDTQPALSSESTGGDTVTSSDGADIFASSASVATSTDSNPALSSASTVSYANDPVESSSSVSDGGMGGFGGGDMGGFGGGGQGGIGVKMKILFLQMKILSC